MTQVAWTAIGLLAAALFGNFWYLGTKIDAINARLDALAARLDARINMLGASLQTHIEHHPS